MPLHERACRTGTRMRAGYTAMGTQSSLWCTIAAFRHAIFVRARICIRAQTAPVTMQPAATPTSTMYMLHVQKKDDKLAESMQQLQREAPGLDICCHWAVKQHYRGGPDGTHPQLQQHLQTCQDMAHGGHALPSVLLVNGSGPKRPYDTVAALRMLRDERARHGSSGDSVQVHVAFNPYFPEARPCPCIVQAYCIHNAGCWSRHRGTSRQQHLHSCNLSLGISVGCF